MIDIERLGILLDRGEAVAAANRHARTDLTEAEATLREARGELAVAEAAAPRYHGPDAGRAVLTSLVDTKRVKCEALSASIHRKRAAQAELERRVQLWLPYLTNLRTLARKQGVEL